MQFINQYSFLLLGAVLTLILALYLLRDGLDKQDLLALAALILGFVLAFLWLQPGQSSLEQVQEVQARIGRGQAVLLEFQSNY